MPDPPPISPSNGIRRTVREFLVALRRPDTYAWGRNPYAVFGLLWGLPVPLATLSVAAWVGAQPVSPAGWWWAVQTHPWQWLFVAHPLLFAVVFGAIGTVAADRGRRIDELLHQLRVRADTDGLTGLLNHRAFQVRLREETTRAVREGNSISLLFCDIDHFKRLNDEHGHQAGDRILAELGVRLRGLVRPYDVVARYGGEEFAVILPGSDAAEAAVAGERVCAGVAARPFGVGGGAGLSVTISVGVATRGSDQSVADWLRAADGRLYEAKRSGRNRVVAAPVGAEPPTSAPV